MIKTEVRTGILQLQPYKRFPGLVQLLEAMATSGVPEITMTEDSAAQGLSIKTLSQTAMTHSLVKSFSAMKASLRVSYQVPITVTKVSFSP